MTTTTRLIFLDFDGVLNQMTQRPGDKFGRQYNYARWIDPACMARLNRIVDATGAKLVISSSWRNLVHNGSMTIAGFQAMMRSHGCEAEVLDVVGPNPHDLERWQLIAEWLKGYCGGRVKVGASTRFCILDDDASAFGGRPGVQTDGKVGLLDWGVDLAIQILLRE
jgi:hypothetical protein